MKSFMSKIVLVSLSIISIGASANELVSLSCKTQKMEAPRTKGVALITLKVDSKAGTGFSNLRISLTDDHAVTTWYQDGEHRAYGEGTSFSTPAASMYQDDITRRGDQQLKGSLGGTLVEFCLKKDCSDQKVPIVSRSNMKFLFNGLTLYCSIIK